MRTIKFRGKDIETGKWVCGFYVRLEDTFRKHINGKERITHRIYPGFADSCASHDGYDFSGDWHEVDPETIGQFTGLIDKNGIDIYEGDVYRYDNPDSINEVSYCTGGGFAGFDFSPAKHSENRLLNVEVIGNIHDNSELLK